MIVLLVKRNFTLQITAIIGNIIIKTFILHGMFISTHTKHSLFAIFVCTALYLLVILTVETGCDVYVVMMTT